MASHRHRFDISVLIRGHAGLSSPPFHWTSQNTELLFLVMPPTLGCHHLATHLNQRSTGRRGPIWHTMCVDRNGSQGYFLGVNVVVSTGSLWLMFVQCRQVRLLTKS
jgi:hypothetical protein